MWTDCERTWPNQRLSQRVRTFLIIKRLVTESFQNLKTPVKCPLVSSISVSLAHNFAVHTQDANGPARAESEGRPGPAHAIKTTAWPKQISPGQARAKYTARASMNRVFVVKN